MSFEFARFRDITEYSTNAMIIPSKVALPFTLEHRGSVQGAKLRNILDKKEKTGEKVIFCSNYLGIIGKKV